MHQRQVPRGQRVVTARCGRLPTIWLAAATVLLLGCTLAAPADTDTAEVVRVIDGDTLDVATGAGTVRVRVLGIDTPELAGDGRPAECMANQASQRVVDLVAGRPVVLVGDPTQPDQDRYGRRLAYIEVDGRDLGHQLIIEGLARTYHPRGQAPPAREGLYEAAQRDAHAFQRGLWMCR